MRALIQVVSNANVVINNSTVGKINKGLCIFLGVSHKDTIEICENSLLKILKLRIFNDENGKTNLALKDVNGSILLVSQFTLYANCVKGNRPSFIDAGQPDLANHIYNHAISYIKTQGYSVETGKFKEDMLVTLTNDGPFTIWLDSEMLNL